MKREGLATMRTTIEVADDVLAATRALAAAWGVSLGVALSDLARRGLAARLPLSDRNGFPVFQVTGGQFGHEDVLAAMASEDQELAEQFATPE